MMDETTALRMEEDGKEAKSGNNAGKPKSSSANEMKPLKRVTVGAGLHDEKEALCGGNDGLAGKTQTDSSSKFHHNSSGSMSKRKTNSDPTFVRRVGRTATTEEPFERPASQLGSRKSLASIKTRKTSISRSEYHADLKPGLKATISRNLVFAASIIVFGCSFQFGYNIGVLNQPDKLILEFYNETYTERYGYISDEALKFLSSLTTALFIPGGMAGAFLGGWLADTLGRKKSILLSHAFVIVGAAISSACVLAKAPEMLMVGRILVGINSGLGNCLAPMFLTEISPFNLRGAFGTVNQLSITLGILVSSVFGLPALLGRPDIWPILILLELIPALTSLCILPFLPETPRYLLLIQGKRDEACKSLKFYRRTNDVVTDMEEMDTEFQKQQTVGKKQAPAFTMKQLFTSRDFRMPLFVACMLQVIQQFSGINAVFFYSGDIFISAGVPESQIPYAVVGTNAVNVLMTVVSVFVMDVAGRRILLLVPMVAMCVDLIIITVSLNLQATYHWFAYVSIVCIVIYVICFAVGLGPIPMMIGAELFRQGPRPKAMATAGFTNWIFTLIVALSFKSLAEICGNFVFLVFLVLMIGFVAFIYFLVPETKNKTFEEIANKFAPGDHVEVEAVVEEGDDDVFAPPPPDDGDDHHLVMLEFGNRKDTAND